LIKHTIPSNCALDSFIPELIEGTLDKLNEWEKKGYNIILITGRKESMRSVTIKQLSKLGIYYDHLIMGVGGGPRYLINDFKPNGDESAFSINIDRNKGVGDLNI
jgi:hypothetical protein